ncbi:T9SS type A sorting domain-containing protein, partial [bacterium]|nr:T9SS type A sorting domain-containing protein [bacterium]
DPCTHAKVIEYMNDLVTTVTSQDSLFIFTTDHGGGNSTGNDSYLNLWNGEQLRDDEFADELDDISFAQCIITMEQCYSGGFIDDVAAIDGVVISTAANANEYSWAMPPDYVYDTYVYHWTAAVAGNEPGWPHGMGGAAVDADTDDDGFVTAREAFVYAEAEDQDNEHPQYLDVSGIGESISLWGGGLDGPYVKMNSYTVDGDNGDSLLDPGEGADISVTLENIGTENATNVVGNLSSSDSDITVNTGTVNWGTIASGATAVSPTDFRITVGSGAGNPERYSLDLHITGDGGIDKNYVLSLTVGNQWGFVDDIEGGENGWTHSGTADQWHIESARYHSADNSWKCGGNGTGDHADNMNCTLDSPLVLIGTTSPTLDFWTWYELESSYDYCYLKFDGDTLATFNGNATSWAERSYDLASYAGAVGNFQFHFTSDGSQVREGFYFDDFNLQPVSGGSAVELVGFSVNGNEDGVMLSWKLDNPETAAAFDLYRQDGVLVDSMVIGNGDRDSGTPLNAAPLTGGRSEYSFLDANVADGGDYLYYLKATDVEGSGYLFGPVELHYTTERELALSLENAYPNPTAGEVALSFSLAADNQAVSLAVYDLSGRLVETILENTLSAGRYTVHWDASANPAGVYFYRLSTDEESLTHRLVISR